jgi:prevent-host-death family protein
MRRKPQDVPESLTMAEARERLADVLDAAEDGRATVIVRNSVPSAAVISARQFAALREFERARAAADSDDEYRLCRPNNDDRFQYRSGQVDLVDGKRV